MNPAIYDTVTCDIGTAQDMTLRATGSVIKFQGFLAVYEEKQDHSEEQKDALLPKMEEGQALQLQDIDSQQSFTRPPPRYTEASLVKDLESQGIGRPSTYASIMNKIQSREYTEKERTSLKPTELGRVITQMLEENFPDVMNIGFTAKMEQDLDEIAENDSDWKQFISEFWEKFIPQVEKAVKEAHVPKIPTDLDCPQCKKSKLQKIWARNKYFYGCSDYPECKFTCPLEALNFNKDEYAENFDWDQPCPRCAKPMILRHGRFGPFLGCSDYPNCNGIVNIPKKGDPDPEDLPMCPAIGCPGKIQQRRSRFGKIFFSCSTFPDCNVIVNSIEDLTTKYPDHPRTPYEKKKKAFGKKGAAKKGAAKKGAAKKGAAKKTTKKKKSPASGAATKTHPLSEELASLIGHKELSRGEVIKYTWDYIKKHNLQNPENKRQIVPDENLAKVLGSSDPIDMMKLSGLLTKHILK